VVVVAVVVVVVVEVVVGNVVVIVSTNGLGGRAAVGGKPADGGATFLSLEMKAFTSSGPNVIKLFRPKFTNVHNKRYCLSLTSFSCLV
jgi:hypothetical protein